MHWPNFRENKGVSSEIYELAVVDDELASKVAVSKCPTSECGWTRRATMRPVICIWTSGNNTDSHHNHNTFVLWYPN